MPSLDRQSCLGLRGLVAARVVKDYPLLRKGRETPVAVPMLLVVLVARIVAVVPVVRPTGPQTEQIVPRMGLKNCQNHRMWVPVVMDREYCLVNPTLACLAAEIVARPVLVPRDLVTLAHPMKAGSLEP